MIITYLRSSSYGTDEWCRFQWFLSYNLGLPQKSNKAAEKGNVIHKVMECLALYKVAKDEGRDFIEDESIGKLSLELCYPENLLGIAYSYHRDKSTHLEWLPKDLTECKLWLRKALAYEEGRYDPRNRDIYAPEQHFDIVIDKPWAKYEYQLPDGSIIEGQLAIKGTMDLVTILEPSVLEVIDYKTGQRKDWITGKEKDFAKLSVDPQLRMYYYACTKLYPDMEAIIMSIFYINKGGVFSLAFGSRDIEATEQMLKRKFESIKNTAVPKLNISKKCWTMCPYGPKGGFYKETGLTTCQAINREVRLYGINTVMKNHTHPGFEIHKYQDGGGKTTEQRHGDNKI